jgi:5-(aminomethyl)-3-furanmethanol phosphate kinase
MSALVVKIGGSLWRSRRLGAWIAALRQYPSALTIVPGGGPFADAVRAAQPQMSFSDDAAHKMALLGMEQYGLALADLFPGLVLFQTPQEAAAVHTLKHIAVWRPTAMALTARIEAGWDITSDSLAAFYARASGATRLLLIKSVDAAEELADLVDPCFPTFAEGLEVYLAGPRALRQATEILAKGAVPGSRVSLKASGTAPAPPRPELRP